MISPEVYRHCGWSEAIHFQAMNGCFAFAMTTLA